MIRSSRQLDERETEGRDEKKGQRTQYSRPNPFRVELGDIGLQTHGGKSDGQQKGSKRSDSLPGFSGNINDAVEPDDGDKAEDEPGNGRADGFSRSAARREAGFHV